MAHFCDAAHAFNNSLQIAQPEQAPLESGQTQKGFSLARAVTYIRVIIANGFAGKPARKTDKIIALSARCLEPTRQRYPIPQRSALI